MKTVRVAGSIGIDFDGEFEYDETKESQEEAIANLTPEDIRRLHMLDYESAIVKIVYPL